MAAPDGAPVDVVDVATAAVEFAAKVKVLETAEDMERRALDILA